MPLKTRIALAVKNGRIKVLEETIQSLQLEHLRYSSVNMSSLANMTEEKIECVKGAMDVDGRLVMFAVFHELSEILCVLCDHFDQTLVYKFIDIVILTEIIADRDAQEMQSLLEHTYVDRRRFSYQDRHMFRVSSKPRPRNSYQYEHMFTNVAAAAGTWRRKERPSPLRTNGRRGGSWRPRWSTRSNAGTTFARVIAR